MKTRTLIAILLTVILVGCTRGHGRIFDYECVTPTGNVQFSVTGAEYENVRDDTVMILKGRTWIYYKMAPGDRCGVKTTNIGGASL